MTPDEQLRALAAEGLSDPAIAVRMNVSPRTVLRHRHRLGIGSEWTPPKAPHGTVARYAKPTSCRCVECTRANREAQTAWRRSQQRATQDAPAYGTPWTEDEDDLLRAAPADRTTADLARELGRSYDATRKRRERLRGEAS